MYRGPRQRVGARRGRAGSAETSVGEFSRAALILLSEQRDDRQRDALREAREVTSPPTEARVHAVLLAEGGSDGYQANKPVGCPQERRVTIARQALSRGAGPRQPDQRLHEVPGCQPSRCLNIPFV